MLVLEFSPANLRLLNRNLGENPALSDRIQIYQATLWDNSTDTMDFNEAGPGTTVGTGGLRARTRSIDKRAETQKSREDRLHQNGHRRSLRQDAQWCS